MRQRVNLCAYFNEWCVIGRSSPYGYVSGKNLFAMEDPDGDHSEEAWSRRLPLVLQVFFRA
jgi:hypothetical protein